MQRSPGQRQRGTRPRKPAGLESGSAPDPSVTEQVAPCLLLPPQSGVTPSTARGCRGHHLSEARKWLARCPVLGVTAAPHPFPPYTASQPCRVSVLESSVRPISSVGARSSG